LNRDALLAPYLKALAQFRQDVRTLAKEKKTPGEMLALCDNFRDEVMIPLGVRLEDSGEFPYKVQDSAQLLAEREQAKRKAREGVIQKVKTNLTKKQKDLETWEVKSQGKPLFFYLITSFTRFFLSLVLNFNFFFSSSFLFCASSCAS
jgi:cysteinyl-tRNA synthetase